ncbi:MAG: EamA family transporter [Sideroxydans sp.]|nr:EamA family transporter [Sideroxydans sp.]
MLAAGFLFGCMGVFVKLAAAAHYSSGELVFYRSLFGLLLVFVMLHGKRTPLATPHGMGHVWRGVSGTVAMILFFYCITALPLATAITLNYTSSLFLTAFTILVFKDKFHLPLTGALALGFAGVVLLLQPTLARDQLLPGLLGLISGLLAGVALLNVRQLGRLGEPAVRIVFYFNLVATLVSGLWMLFTPLHAVSWSSLPLLVAIGACATLAQLAMTRAYRLGQTLAVSALSYSTIAFASLFGMLLWHEMLPLSGWLGMLLIATSGVLSLKLAPRHPEPVNKKLGNAS